ncbi:hypothetical protein KO525_15935 [Psychrosphaera sp. B3R10]|uniref:hypothetical protein n=1 Tax=unclassified Psychrosphaera TaxID=2641570 RepID=UPI001C0A5487|nr:MULTISPECIES: hypothetical protein [unclassified Psychrosphaera]MBU2880903.1 hypothetical protein [Psychrosphaera sp. I2R16]MBU2990878.1 hypothetical protein [Psychrosphaera sp. B3R10]
MSHIPSSSQLGQVTQNRAADVTIALVSSPIRAVAKVDQHLLLTVQNMPQLTNIDISPKRVSINQRQLLDSQTVLLMQATTRLEVYLSSSLRPANLTLNPAMTVLMTQYLSRQQNDKNVSVPKEINKLLSQLTGVSSSKLDHRLTQLELRNNQLTALLFMDDPITEISASKRQIGQTNQDSSSSLLNLIILLDEKAKSLISIKQQSSSNNDQKIEQQLLSFDFQITLESIGIARCNVRLRNQDLQFTNTCSSAVMLERVNSCWPLLQNRFTALGFECQANFAVDSALIQPSPAKSTGLIDIKI